jgi:TetR/AcrR family transcriptional regulator
MSIHEGAAGLEPSSKDRILRTALTVFSKKGFEGARVDEIARLAGVNKALIYYYFTSKDDILEALFQGAIEDFSKHIDWSIFMLPEIIESDAALDRSMDVFLSFIEERRELFTVAIMELLKDSERRARIIKLLGAEIEKQYAAFSDSLGGAPGAQGMVTEFFTGLMPIIMFVILKEPWKELYKQKDAELDRMFKTAIRETHVRYTYELIQANKSDH